MKQSVTAFIAAVIGGLVSYLLVSHSSSARAAPPSRIETRELVLLNERSQVAARFRSENGRTVLTLYDGDSDPALEIGSDTVRGSRFVRMYSRTGKVLAAINSLPPNAESTLYLGDQRREARIVIGAIQSDVQGTNPVNEWGIQIYRPAAVLPVFGVLVMPGANGSGYTAGLHLVKPNGEEWSAP